MFKLYTMKRTSQDADDKIPTSNIRRTDNPDEPCNLMLSTPVRTNDCREIHAEDENGGEAINLMKCIQRGEEKLAMSLMGQPLSAEDYITDEGITALMMSIIYESSTELVQALLFHGAGTEINMRSPVDGNTALMLAAERGRFDVVSILLGAGAYIDAKNTNDNETALMKAARNGHTKVFGLLKDSGANAAHRNNKSETAFIIASDNLQIEICEIIFKIENPRVMPISHTKLADLQYSAFSGNTEVIAYDLSAHEDLVSNHSLINKNTGNFEQDVINFFLKRIGSINQDNYKDNDIYDNYGIEKVISVFSSVKILINIQKGSIYGSTQAKLNENFRKQLCNNSRKQLMSKYSNDGGPPIGDMTAVWISDTLVDSLFNTQFLDFSTSCIAKSVISDSQGNSAKVEIWFYGSNSCKEVKIQFIKQSEVYPTVYMYLQPLTVVIADGNCNDGKYHNKLQITKFLGELIKRYYGFGDILCRYAENIHDNEFISQAILHADHLKDSPPEEDKIDTFKILIRNGFNFNAKTLAEETVWEAVIRLYQSNSHMENVLDTLIKDYGANIHLTNLRHKNIFQEMITNGWQISHIGEIMRPHVNESEIQKLEPLTSEDLGYCPECVYEAQELKLPLHESCKELLQVRQKIRFINNLPRENTVSTVSNEEYDAIASCYINLRYMKNIGHRRLACGHSHASIVAAALTCWKTKENDVVVDKRGRNPLHMYAFYGQQIHLKYPGKPKEEIDLWQKELAKPDFLCLISQVDNLGQTPLHYLTQHGADELLKEILERFHESDFLNESINTKDRFGRTVSHHSALNYNSYERKSIYKELSSKRASEESKDNFHRTPYECWKKVHNISNRERECSSFFTNVDINIKDKMNVNILKSTHALISLDLSAMLDSLSLMEALFSFSSADEAIKPLFAESDAICSEINDQLCKFIKRLVKCANKSSNIFKGEAYLVGSGREETKIGFSNEFDFNIELVAFSQICEIFVTPECPPGFVHVRLKQLTTAKDKVNFEGFFDEKHFLKTLEIKNMFEKHMKEVLKQKCFWDNEHYFEMTSHQDELFNVYQTNNCHFTITLKVVKTVYPTISIDIVPVLHLPCYRSSESIERVASMIQSKDCILVLVQPYKIHSWLPKNTQYARISFAKADSEIIRNCPETIKLVFRITKYVNEYLYNTEHVRGFNVSSHSLKTMLMYCLAAKIRNKRRQVWYKSVSTIAFDNRQVIQWLNNMFNCFLCFQKLDFLPSFFLSPFCLPLFGHERYFRENVIRLAKSCPSENFKCDVLIEKYIKEDDLNPRLAVLPQQNVSSYKSKIYIFNAEFDERIPLPLDTMLYVVYKVSQDCYISHRLSDHENYLIEYFDSDRFYSYLNGPQAMNWFNSLKK